MKTKRRKTTVVLEKHEEAPTPTENADHRTKLLHESYERLNSALKQANTLFERLALHQTVAVDTESGELCWAYCQGRWQLCMTAEMDLDDIKVPLLSCSSDLRKEAVDYLHALFEKMLSRIEEELESIDSATNEANRFLKDADTELNRGG